MCHKLGNKKLQTLALLNQVLEETRLEGSPLPGDEFYREYENSEMHETKALIGQIKGVHALRKIR